jgi:threonylcarbamoyladenosine tRNA methylthiotransferase MtaB
MPRFLDMLERFRDRMPDVAFTTDVIVGFPGETEAEFEETLESCRRAQFMKIHVFPFSARRDTPAATMPDQVAPEVKRDRVRRLALLERELATDYYARWIDRPLEVLVERESEDRPGWLRGTDRMYIPVELPGSRSEIGEFVTVTGHCVHREFLEARRDEVHERLQTAR